MLRLVRLIPVVLLLALLPMSPALAQSGSATGTPEARVLPASDLGKLYYVGSFSSVAGSGDTQRDLRRLWPSGRAAGAAFGGHREMHLLLVATLPLTRLLAAANLAPTKGFQGPIR